MFNCSCPREERHSSYWYFQLIFIVLVYTSICIVNILATIFSLLPITQSKPMKTWLLISCYISGFIGGVSCAYGEFLQAFIGAPHNKCVTIPDRKIPRLLGAQVGMYCLFVLSLLRYSTFKRPLHVHSKRLKLAVISAIWFTALTTTILVKSYSGTTTAETIQSTLLTVPVLASIFVNSFLIRKLQQGRVAANHQTMRERADRVWKLVTVLIIVYSTSLIFAVLSGLVLRVNLPLNVSTRAAIWLKHVMQILSFSIESVAYFLMKIPDQSCLFICCRITDEELEQRVENVENQDVQNVHQIVPQL